MHTASVHDVRGGLHAKSKLHHKLTRLIPSPCLLTDGRMSFWFGWSDVWLAYMPACIV